MLAEKLNMNTNDAESWIVNLIKNARLGIWGWHFFLSYIE